MKRPYAFGLLLAPLLLCQPAWSADFSDPTWPCLQRKVETLSLGIMWPHPVDPPEPRATIAAEAHELAETLILRRINLEDGRALVADFAGSHSDLSVQDLGTIFREVFEQISRDRSDIIQGIERYSLSQIALSQSIDETREQMSTLMKADTPDYDEVDRLEEKLDWDERIFRDRAQSLTYVCETPVILEKRAYSIAQLLLEHAPK